MLLLYLIGMPKYSIDTSVLKTSKSGSINEMLKSFKECNLFLFETTKEEKKLTEVLANFCNSEIEESEPGIIFS